MYDLDLLIKCAHEFMLEKEYSQSTIYHHARSWIRLQRWYDKNGFQGYDIGIQEYYFEEVGLDGGFITKHRKQERSHVERLISIAETGSPPKHEAVRTYIVPKGFTTACDEYEKKLKERGLKSSTIQGYLSSARHFCSACGASAPKTLTTLSVAKFAESIAQCAPQTRSQKLYVVRDFVRFLAERGVCAPEVAQSMLRIPGHKHSSIPSAYSPIEVLALLEKQPLDSHLRPKRDRAIMLLAALLGMRVSDIKALKLSDIDWRSKTLSFIQQKTRVAQVLPMPEEVWLALAEYLRDERPDIESDRVFITAYAPYHPIDSSHVFHRGVTHAFRDAGIDTSGKHHGMHSLRHSTATNMLANGTPYPTISAVLGHSSTNITRRYLSIDVESLRDIALEVPLCKR